MSYVFGIDLGTTYSCISYIDEYGKAVVLKNGEGDHTTPSVVMIESESNIVVGVEAKRSVDMEPDKTCQFIKRKMGKENDSIVINGNTYHAPEISSMILKKIVQDANAELQQIGVLKEGELVKDVVITCPAYFGMNERNATSSAGELAGLNVLNIINEPTAAAISYGVSGDSKNETVLVYDLGGGTFDITVMNIQGENISVVCAGGDDQLGGKDWDEALIEYIRERYEEMYEYDISEDPELIAGLYGDVEQYKKTLSTREKTNLSVNGPEGRLREELTREKYEEITSSLLNRTRNLLDDVLQSAQKQGYSLDKINKVLLVGGSSRMPQVSAMIEEVYHVTPVLADPDEAVAKGAAIYASNEKSFEDFILSESSRTGMSVESLKERNLVTGEVDKQFSLSAGTTGGMGIKLNITNALSRTYGVSILENDRLVIRNMLMINDKIPATVAQTFATVSDNQSGISIEIYESLSTEEIIEIDGKEPLTIIAMKFTKSVPMGTAVTIQIALDNAGIMSIIAEELLHHSRLDTTFALSNQMTEEERNLAINRMAVANVE
ncbi:MAG: Hsp70 family protein [Eubacteriales bacterium]